MKTKLFVFCILCIVFFNIQTSSQTIDTLSNGTIIFSNDGQYFDVTNNHKIHICPKSLMIEYKQNTDSYKLEEFEVANGLVDKYELGIDSILYTLINSHDFLSIVSRLLSSDIVSGITLAHYLNYTSDPICEKITLPPNDYLYKQYNLGFPTYMDPNYQWYLTRLDVESAWGITKGDKHVKIGVLDTGVEWYKADEFGPSPDNESTHRGWNYNNMSYDTKASGEFGEYKEHGTMVTNIICARTNNNDETDKAGYAAGIAGGWNADTLNIYMYVTGDDQGQNDLWVSDAITKALAKGIRLFNLSFGVLPDILNNDPPKPCDYFCQEYQTLCNTIKNAYTNDSATFFASVGNHGSDFPSQVAWPACMFPYVLAVGGSNYEDCEWNNGPDQNTNYGPDTFISAPADYILQPIFDDTGNTTDYEIKNGETSGASAIVTGVAGLMLSINPCLRSNDIREILQHTADQTGFNHNGTHYNYHNDDPDRPGHSDELGYGRINAYEAVKAAGFPGAQGGPECTTIISDETWSSLRCFTENITIQQDVTLTIKGKVKMFPDKKIIVEPGAHLVIDGGTITSRCEGEFWDGIQVQSDDYIGSNKGIVDINHNAIIEHAKCGILICTVPETPIYNLQNSPGHGVIHATSVTFRNCITGVNFGNSEPFTYNSSYFYYCTFQVDDKNYYTQYGIDPVSFVMMNGVSGVRFHNCDFINTSSHPYYLDGITAFVSSFSVTGEVTPNWQPCNFVNLHNAIRGLGGDHYGSYTVSHSTFSNNVHGIYLSNASYSQITSNTFNIIQSNGAYGVYIQNSTGYWIEDNTFNGLNGNGLGLYIRNSGVDNNWVHDNKFNNLYYASIADGINRGEVDGALRQHEEKGSGLYFKCNEFQNNLYDISITADPSRPYSIDLGIARYQGACLLNDTAPAGNLFTKATSRYNIYNDENIILYTHHRFIEILPEKVKPYPITDKTVGLREDEPVAYSRERSCPSWLISRENISTDEIKNKLSQYKDSINISSAQLAQVIDQGSTETLNNEVLFSVPDSAINLYNKLLQISPFLSDTVLKSSIENEYILINQMLHDILVANPQAAKSNSVMSRLDDRIIPMPENMMDDVLNGLDTTASKEQMDMQIAVYKEHRDFLLNTLIRRYLQDTTITNRRDSLLDLLNNESSLRSKYQMTLLYLQNGQNNLSNSTFSEIPQQFSLDQTEQQIHQDYSTLLNILQQTPVLYNFKHLDSLSINTLKDLASRDDFIPGSIARNILISRGSIAYQEPINLPDETKSGKRNRPNGSVNNSQSNTGCSLQLSPNPANTFVVVGYEIKDKIGPYKLLIFDTKGNILDDILLSKPKDSFILELNNNFNDVCFFTLMSNNTKIISKKLIILK